MIGPLLKASVVAVDALIWCGECIAGAWFETIGAGGLTLKVHAMVAHGKIALYCY